LSITNTTSTPVIELLSATTARNGYLTSTDWTTFNSKQSTITLTTTGTSGASTLVGSTLNIPQYQSVITNPVTGTGTTNYMPKWTSSSSLNNSLVYDNGTNIGIGTITPSYKLDVVGNSRIVSSGNTRFYIDTTSATPNTGFALSVSNSAKWSVAAYKPSGANLSYVLYNEQTGTNSLFIQGDTNNITIGSIVDSGYKIDVLGTARFGGNSLVSLNQNAETSFLVSNTTSGGSSSAQIKATSSGGSVQVGKWSGASSTYKTIVANDSFLYNAGVGNISILNDYASGNINFSSGGVSTAQMTLFTTGNLGINTTTNAGYKLDVNGSLRYTGGGIFQGGTNTPASIGAYIMTYVSSTTSYIHSYNNTSYAPLALRASNTFFYSGQGSYPQWSLDNTGMNLVDANLGTTVHQFARDGVSYSSGTTTYNGYSLTPTINNTGT
jgi:hypothetical protein